MIRIMIRKLHLARTVRVHDKQVLSPTSFRTTTEHNLASVRRIVAGPSDNPKLYEIRAVNPHGVQLTAGREQQALAIR
jgi:hypothetical protein